MRPLPFLGGSNRCPARVSESVWRTAMVPETWKTLDREMVEALIGQEV
jgi:hypothetical protein